MAAGAIRPDIGPDDLLRALVGICYAQERPGWQAKVLPLVDVFVEGLRRWPDQGQDAGLTKRPERVPLLRHAGIGAPKIGESRHRLTEQNLPVDTPCELSNY